jgi:septal ring factor EnvC (AmiA/AmiB activator)
MAPTGNPTDIFKDLITPKYLQEICRLYDLSSKKADLSFIMATHGNACNQELRDQLANFAQQLTTVQAALTAVQECNAVLTADLNTLHAANTQLEDDARQASNDLRAAQQTAADAAIAAAVAQRTATAAQQGTGAAAGATIQQQGGQTAATPVVFTATSAMVCHEDLINHHTKDWF